MKSFATTYRKNMINMSFDRPLHVLFNKIFVIKFVDIREDIWIFKLVHSNQWKSNKIWNFHIILSNFNTRWLLVNAQPQKCEYFHNHTRYWHSVFFCGKVQFQSIFKRNTIIFRRLYHSTSGISWNFYLNKSLELSRPEIFLYNIASVMN